MPTRHPSSNDELHLHEAYLLLVLCDEKGTLNWRASFHTYGLAGAAFAELALAGRLELGEEKDPFVSVRDARPTGDDVLDESLLKINTASRRARASTWVARLSRLPRLRHRTAAALCRRGILKAEEQQILLIFRRTVYPEIDPRPERELMARLKRAIVGDATEVDPHTGVLLALADATGVLNAAFGRKFLRPHRARIKAITSGQRMAQGAQAAIAAARAAVVAITTATAAAAAAAG
ncbi:MAG: GPP34 family phosphoprotein [Phycisphaerales bacterium]|nr:GPP34 family phosphoprotein [Phycisphaerales bacterium]